MPAFDPGSFRDPTSRVFYAEGAVFRGLTPHAMQEWTALSSAAFFRRFVTEGKLVHTEPVAPDALPHGVSLEQWALILKHHTIPFISYPYEWSFSMLKDAALLHLDLLQAALAEDMILKDATPFNIQWNGSQPIFIDIPSFERLRHGEPWIGYRQFCQLFLYPLLLQAYKGLPFQPWLRGSIDGVTPVDCASLMSWRDLVRPGVLSHVTLQAKVQSAYAGSDRNMKRELHSAGFHKNMIQANVRRLTGLLQRLGWKQTKSTWSTYAENTPYTLAGREHKANFVRRVTASQTWDLVWDLGCNTGTFSRIAAQNANSVVAMDIDPLVIERFYVSLKNKRQQTILPLISNLADPSPNLGWRGLERKALRERGNPDLILCLALLHHMVIGAHIPLKEFVDWLAELGGALIIEFVTRDDPMVKTLLQNKADHYTDYDLAYFERCLSEAYDIRKREPLETKTRILYFAHSKKRS